jgi:hypothetical protein
MSNGTRPFVEFDPVGGLWFCTVSLSSIIAAHDDDDDHDHADFSLFSLPSIAGSD